MGKVELKRRRSGVVDVRLAAGSFGETNLARINAEVAAQNVPHRVTAVHIGDTGDGIAEVLHPLTNYREHPIDNVAYAIANGIATGLVIGGCQFLFAVPPTHLLIPMLGISVLPFLFNFMGYNLRHSHIWVRWPGALAYLWGCPAHHQIHHSYRPKHINKNFAFMFPVWDVIFGTYVMPDDERDIRFGLGTSEEREYRSCLSLYFLPFVKTYRRLCGLRSPAHKEQI